MANILAMCRPCATLPQRNAGNHPKSRPMRSSTRNHTRRRNCEPDACVTCAKFALQRSRRLRKSCYHHARRLPATLHQLALEMRGRCCPYSPSVSHRRNLGLNSLLATRRGRPPAGGRPLGELSRSAGRSRGSAHRSGGRTPSEPATPPLSPGRRCPRCAPRGRRGPGRRSRTRPGPHGACRSGRRPGRTWPCRT
jgi:hypothetical protein